MPLAFLDLPHDDPGARGHEHGLRLAAQIARNVRTCYRRCENDGLDHAAVRRQAGMWAEVILARRPDVAVEIAAVAAGAQLDPLDITLLNVRFEIGYPLKARVVSAAAPLDGCTSFALLPEATADGHTRVGQTLDGSAAFAGNLAVLRSSRAHGLTLLGLHEAGSVGPSLGLNSAGIGVVYNSLITPACAAPPRGLPFRLRMLGILEAPTFAHAIDVALQTPRPTATHLLLGHRDGEALGLELSQTQAAYLHPERGILAHANHFERLEGVTSLFERLLPDSLFRGPRMSRHLAARRGALDEAALRRALSDHFSYPRSICLHSNPDLSLERRALTLSGAILDLAAGVLAATDGPPCENPLQRFALSQPAPLPA